MSEVDAPRYLIRTPSGDCGPFSRLQLLAFAAQGQFQSSLKVLDQETGAEPTVAEIVAQAADGAGKPIAAPPVAASVAPRPIPGRVGTAAPRGTVQRAAAPPAFPAVPAPPMPQGGILDLDDLGLPELTPELVQPAKPPVSASPGAARSGTSGQKLVTTRSPRKGASSTRTITPGRRRPSTVKAKARRGDDSSDDDEEGGGSSPLAMAAIGLGAGLLLAGLVLAGIYVVPRLGSPKAHTAVQQGIQALQRNDLPAAVRVLTSDGQYADLRIAWDSLRQTKLEDADRRAWDALLHTMCGVDQETKLYMTLQGNTVFKLLRAAPVEMQTQLVRSAKGALGEDNAAVVTLVNALHALLGMNALTSPERVRPVLRQACETVKGIGVAQVADLQAQDFSQFLRSCGKAVAGLKKMLAVYDIDLDGLLTSARAETLFDDGRTAKVNVSYLLQGKPASFAVQLRMEGGRWCLELPGREKWVALKGLLWPAAPEVQPAENPPVVPPAAGPKEGRPAEKPADSTPAPATPAAGADASLAPSAQPKTTPPASGLPGAGGEVP